MSNSVYFIKVYRIKASKIIKILLKSSAEAKNRQKQCVLILRLFHFWYFRLSFLWLTAEIDRTFGERVRA